MRAGFAKLLCSLVAASLLSAGRFAIDWTAQSDSDARTATAYAHMIGNGDLQAASRCTRVGYIDVVLRRVASIKRRHGDADASCR